MAPATFKQELDPSKDNENGKILASRYVKAGIDPGKSTADLRDVAASARRMPPMTSIRTTFRAKPSRLKRIISAPCRRRTGIDQSDRSPISLWPISLCDWIIFSPLSLRWGYSLVSWAGLRFFWGFARWPGLGPVRKWVAIGVRLAVMLLLILILGDIKLVRKNTDVELMVVRDISQSTGLVTDFPGKFLQSSLDDYLLAATEKANSPSRQDGDRVGEISFNEHAYIDAIPKPDAFAGGARGARAGHGHGCGRGDPAWAWRRWGTNSMHRMLLIWDGNATAGDLNAALAAASSQHVPIDVMPLQYNVEHEVMMDKFIAPTRRQEGQPFNIDVYINNKNEQDVAGRSVGDGQRQADPAARRQDDRAGDAEARTECGTH